jgi:hypothetical protein
MDMRHAEGVNRGCCDFPSDIGRRCRRSERSRPAARGAAIMDSVSRRQLPLLRLGVGTIARIDARECMRSMTEARARELEGLSHK